MIEPANAAPSTMAKNLRPRFEEIDANGLGVRLVNELEFVPEAGVWLVSVFATIICSINWFCFRLSLPAPKMIFLGGSFRASFQDGFNDSMRHLNWSWANYFFGILCTWLII